MDTEPLQLFDTDPHETDKFPPRVFTTVKEWHQELHCLRLENRKRGYRDGKGYGREEGIHNPRWPIILMTLYTLDVFKYPGKRCRLASLRGMALSCGGSGATRHISFDVSCDRTECNIGRILPVGHGSKFLRHIVHKWRRSP